MITRTTDWSVLVSISGMQLGRQGREKLAMGYPTESKTTILEATVLVLLHHDFFLVLVFGQFWLDSS